MAYRNEFPPICVALGCPEADRLEKLAREACDDDEQFLEIRMDMLEEPQQGIGVIRRLRHRYPELWLLATCRRKQAGGQFRGNVPEQVRLLEAAVDAGAQVIDLEIESVEVAQERLPALQQRTKLVVSYHNFQSTPALAPVLRKLEKAPGHVSKLVTTARKPSDNLRLLDLIRQTHERPLVAFAMGEAGIPSRVLSVGWHCPFTYAAPSLRHSAHLAGKATAPGQVASTLMRRQYHVERHTCETHVYGVIANPVGHSISPAVHNRAFHARRLDAVYLPFLVEERHLSDFVTVANRLPVAGFSVTIPHKQRIMHYLNAVDPEARRIGAVNTVYRRHGKLRGANTDVVGITGPLEKRRKLKGARILIAGNGGAARSAAFALLDKGAQVFLTGRNPARVRALARACGATPLDSQQVSQQKFDVLVHATPLGMHPNVSECFFRDQIPGDSVFDMVYNPLETLLLKKARAAGKQVISGLEMFLEQAAAQFEIWTGMTAPRLAMETVAREALASAHNGH